MKLDKKLQLSLATLATLLLLALSYIPAASAQSSTVSTATVSTGTNIPPPTGCTAPGYLAPSNLLTTLGSNKTVSKGKLSIGTPPPKSDRPYEYLLIGGGLLLALLILIGIIWAIALGVRRAARRNQKDASPPVRKSHAARNVYLVFMLIALIATGSAVVCPFPVPRYPPRTTPPSRTAWSRT